MFRVQFVYQLPQHQKALSDLDTFPSSTTTSLLSLKPDSNIWTERLSLVTVDLEPVPQIAASGGTKLLPPGQNSVHTPAQGSRAPPRFTGQDRSSGWPLLWFESWNMMSPRTGEQSSIHRLSYPIHLTGTIGSRSEIKKSSDRSTRRHRDALVGIWKSWKPDPASSSDLKADSPLHRRTVCLAASPMDVGPPPSNSSRTQGLEQAQSRLHIDKG